MILTGCFFMITILLLCELEQSTAARHRQASRKSETLRIHRQHQIIRTNYGDQHFPYYFGDTHHTANCSEWKWPTTKPEPEVIALTSFDLGTLLPFRHLIGNMSLGVCIRSIYEEEDDIVQMDGTDDRPLDSDVARSRDASASELGCRSGTDVLITMQPLRATEGILQAYKKVVVVIMNPMDTIMQSFQTDFQTVLTSELLGSELFQTYAKAKAFLWRKHLQYWLHQKYVLGVQVQFLRYEDLLYAPETLVRDLGHFLHVDTQTPPTPNPSGLPCAAVSTLYGVWMQTSNKDEWTDAAVGDVVLDETRPFQCQFGYIPCGEDDYAVKALRLLIQGQDARLWHSGERWWLPARSQRRQVHILMTYFEADHIERQVEVDDALTSLVMHPGIDRIHLWMDDPELKPPISSDKLTLVESAGQATYADLFDYANRYLADGETIVAIQNADITWAPDSPGRLQTLHQGLVFALSRHSNRTEYPQTQCDSGGGHNRNLCRDYAGSHDVFAFLPPVDPMALRQLQFKQNTWGAENVVLQELRRSGYVVENPCEEIVTLHYHCSGIRRRTGHSIRIAVEGRQRIRSAFRAAPVSLDEICERVWCNSLNKKK